LVSQFEADETYLDDISEPGRKGLARGLIIEIGAISAPCVLHIPTTVAIPEASMFGRDKAFGQLDAIRGTPTMVVCGYRSKGVPGTIELGPLSITMRWPRIGGALPSIFAPACAVLRRSRVIAITTCIRKR